MLWDSIDPLMYCYGKQGDITPTSFSDVYLTICNLLILGKVEQAKHLLGYSSPDKIKFKIEPADSICNYVNKMCGFFLKPEFISHKFPSDLNLQYNALFQYITGEIDNSDKINEIINNVCEFHLSRGKEFQEFDIDHIALFPSEILVSLLLLNKENKEIIPLEHPLVKDLLNVIINLGNVEIDELFLKVENHLVSIT